MSENILVVGAGGIGLAIVEQYAKANPNNKITVLSRRVQVDLPAEVSQTQIDTTSEDQISQWCQSMSEQDVTFAKVFITLGVLHDDAGPCFPEKRLEDISPEALQHYFSVNTITPLLWVKHLVNLVAKEESSIVVLSARVGSIGDNSLGGWYGYRASKSALNMTLKTASIEYARRKLNTYFIAYHPGTVDTPLSLPFQRNVPKGKLFTPQFTSSQLFNIVNDLTKSDEKFQYLDWQGQSIEN